MTYLRSVYFARCLRLAVALCVGAASSMPAVVVADGATCSAQAARIIGDFGAVQFSVEVADTPQERARGLMFREQMAPFAGMLFIYEHPQSVNFWMKNTLIALDMIFTDQKGIIVSIHKNAIPHDLTPIFGGDEIYSVLELNAGVSARLNIEVGDVLQHPSYGSNAIHPCVIKNHN